MDIETINWFKENDPEHLSTGVYNAYQMDNSKYDQLHYNYNGAKWIASNIAKLIYESDCPLKEYVNEPDVYDIPMIWDPSEEDYRNSMVHSNNL